MGENIIYTVVLEIIILIFTMIKHSIIISHMK